MKWRIGAVVLCSGLFLSGIGAAFLREELRYASPELPPKDWHAPQLGAILNPPELAGHPHAVLLHFYDKHCPCSRFLQDHVRSLAKRFQGKVDVVVVTQTVDDPFTWASRTIEDRHGRLASAAGVFATPQAVLIDKSGKILFRGSYNRSRFCSDPASEYVRIAIEDYVQGKPPRNQSAAQKAFGCSLRKRTAS